MCLGAGASAVLSGLTTRTDRVTLPWNSSRRTMRIPVANVGSYAHPPGLFCTLSDEIIRRSTGGAPERLARGRVDPWMKFQ
jgi:hypothetical protein